MIGLAFEIMTTCPSCSAPLPLNALSLRFICGTCNEVAEFTLDDWSGLLEDALNEGPTSAVGTGSGSTIFARRNYEMLWARFDPYFFDTKDDIALADLPAGLERGFLPHPRGGEPVTVRCLPEEFATILQGVIYLVAEDPHQMPASSALDAMGIASATEPVGFTCPHCGGALQVDGSKRTIECQYCHTSAVLPDQLWMRLHPVTTKKRWFLVFDESQRPYSWEDDVWDAVVDGEGRTYLAVDFDGNTTLHVVCLGLDRKLIWRRDDLNYGVTDGDHHARLLLAGDRLMVWCGERHSATWLSLDDGSQVDKLGGKGGRQPDGGTFSLKGSYSADVDRDGSIVVWHPSWTADARGDDTFEPMRFEATGQQVPMWPGTYLEGQEPPPPPPPKKGLFARLGAVFSEPDAPPEPERSPWFEGLGHKPRRCKEEDVEVCTGADGSILLRYSGSLARFTPDGTKVYQQQSVSYRIDGRVIGLHDGSVIVLVEGQDDADTTIKTISPDGQTTTTLHDNVTQGGTVGEENLIARQADGTIHTFGYGGRWRIIEADGTPRFASKASREFEQEQAAVSEDDDED